MAETTYHLAESQLENGTIDFYTLLGEPHGADTETLRAKIGAVYNFASANRDHRNLNKRREYQALLELLPAARIALLEDPKRARYDAYLAAARADEADTDFETFMNDLLGLTESDADKTSLLGVQEQRAPVRATPAAPVAPANEPRARVTKAPAPPVSSSPAPASGTRSATPFFGAVAGFVVGFVIGLLFLKSLLPVAGGALAGILLGIILAAIGYALLNRKPGGRIGT